MKIDVTGRERESCDDSASCGENSGFSTAGAHSSAVGSRRGFLKLSGGATAATMLALHGMRVDLLANSGSTGRWWVFGQPNSNYSASAEQSLDRYSFKATYVCSPAGGQPDAISIVIRGEVWETEEYEDTVDVTGSVTLSAAIANQTTGVLSASVTPSTAVSLTSPWIDINSNAAQEVRQRYILTLAPILTTSESEHDASISGNLTLKVEREKREYSGNWPFGSWGAWGAFGEFPKSMSIPLNASADSQYDPTL